ncbi:acyl-CoA dehydrogenase [Algimonas ampicilliniresistens]|jgi:acyl-CoA dehydrogenase|uniref:Acyl-CoA dehydrogenase n=1 Tax=Algimonas ampicilliniresistens TaxID=1298735 RepID=A0ABQ5VDZ2_9PROT|nr:acyl-CoA dehydrogenase family protein [Algimonas ampicilliniresistens]GLQ24622.1 acyl-CoA dehydrogenase [Algimonas ampicilliniresistens]
MADVLDFKNPDWYQEEDINMFRDAVYKFYANEMAPHSEEFRKNKKVDRKFWNQAGEYGLLNCAIPEEYGGGGGDYRHEMIIMEELERAEVDGFGLSLHNAIVAPYILHYGTEEQKQKWLPRMASGELVGAICMSEPGTGSDLQNVRTNAKKDGNGWIINGSKTFITNGGTANLLIIVADTGGEGKHSKSLFVVETDDLDGFRRGRILDKVGMEAQDTAELFFDDMKVPADALLGEDTGQGFIQLMTELPQERLNIAVQGVAAMEKALRHTIEYVKDRKAFGQRIIDFQNTQFELAELKTIVTVCKVFTYDCAEKHLRGELDTVTASMAKYWVTDRECEVMDRCLQLYGGYGFMNEYMIGRQWRASRVQRIYGGTNEIMKLVIARSL